MKKVSVKRKITLWLTVLMALLSGLLLVFMLFISQSVATGTAMEQLSRTVRANAAQVSLPEGKLAVGTDFQFYQSGVSSLVYSKGGALLAGQPPVSFSAGEPFENGEIRTVPVGNTHYLVLDLWVPSGWESGVWVRGLLEAPESGETARNLLLVAAIAMPLFLLLAAVGGYRIVRRAFRPLDQISATAAAIGEAKDLSRRIGLPPGGDEFSRLAETFDGLFARLERSFEAEKQFAADASHELRTPVSIIKGACEYAQKYDESEEERRETLDMIHRQAVKMSGLIAQLLTMTRLEQGTERPGMEPVDLGALAGDVVDELDDGTGRLRAELAGGVTVRGDPALLARLLRNLIDNGFKYGKPGGHVWVSVAVEEGEAVLRVKDDGIGIPPEHREKVWQRFYQVDPSRSGEGHGAGLGLAMVDQIARLHGGSMTLESAVGEGSEFVLHLPLEGREGPEKFL